MEQNYIEKRRYPRYNITGTVNVSDKHHTYHGFLKNISFGGIGIELHERLLPFEHYTYAFTVGERIHIKTKGKIQWEIQKDNTYVYGIQFPRLGFITKLKLKGYFYKNEVYKSAN